MEASSENNPKLFKLTGSRHGHPADHQTDSGSVRETPEQEGGRDVGQQFPVAGVPPVGRATVGGRRGHRHVGRRRAADQQSDAGEGERSGHYVSGNGGPMDYKAAANFLALGAQTVQFCTIVMKYGLGIVDELHCGLSYLMAERGFGSVKELIGSALPHPITDFMALSATKKLPEVIRELCEHLRQLRALSVSGHHPGRARSSGVRSGSLHRLLAMRPEMFRGGDLHAGANRARVGRPAGLGNFWSDSQDLGAPTDANSPQGQFCQLTFWFRLP